MSKLLNSEIPERIQVNLSRQISIADGVMSFGEFNDYPQIMEKLIDGSPTASGAANMLARFLSGVGFEADINDIVIGQDEKGKDITVLRLLRNVASSSARNNGYFIKVDYAFSNVSENNLNVVPVIRKLAHVPFKKCRFSASDDADYSPIVYKYDKWEDTSKSFSFNALSVRSQANSKKGITTPVGYHVFNPKKGVLKSQVEHGNFKGQMFFHFFDERYFYPLSIFDSTYLDMDTEQQISIYENNEVRNGFVNHTIVGLSPALDPEQRKANKEHWEGILGSNANKLTIYEMAHAPDGAGIDKNSAVSVQEVKTNIDPELYEGLTSRVQKRIMRCAHNVPSILVDYENGSKLGTTSGEAFKESVNIYNALTNEIRIELGRSLGELLSKFDDARLKSNTNWEIAPLTLTEFETNNENNAVTNIPTTEGDKANKQQ